MTILLDVTDATVRSIAGVLVEPVSFRLSAGRALTILGESGSGKSLLAQAIVGILPDGVRATGTATIAGMATDLAVPTAHRKLWGRQVSILPQEPWLALDPTMRSDRQIAEGHRHIGGMPPAAALAAARRALAGLGLPDAAAKLPGALSGGMAQRVAFAAARAGGAPILIADEPTKGLDVARRDEVIALLMQVVEAGGCVLTITHDLALARQMGGDIAVMVAGRIVEQGEADRIFANPEHAYTRRLVAADPVNWTREPRPEAARRQTILKARGLAKSRGGRLLFSGLDAEIRAGDVVGITGPSGAGKSSLGDILLDLLRPDAGTLERPQGIAHQRYQKLYQDPPSAFAPTIPLGVSLADLVRLHRIDSGRIAPLLERLRLPDALLARRPKEVSGGELQRLALLRALLLDPVFLFADEPTSRLDLITQEETIRLLVELAREQDCAVLLVSHDAALIECVCDRKIEIAA